MSRIALSCLAALLLAPAAQAQEVPGWSGDIAFAYGRNFGQGLNVGGIVGEVKKNVHPQAAVGVRLGGILGVGVNTNQGSASAYSGSPLLLKGEGFLSESPTRPFVGLGAGVTFYGAAGVVGVVNGNQQSVQAYAARGPNFTLMPELGVDIGALRLAVSHGFLIGSNRAIQASIESDGQGGTNTTTEYETYGLGGTVFQIGGHFGGPKNEK